MLYLASVAAALVFEPRGAFLGAQNARAPAASMVLGLFKKAPAGEMVGKVVPTALATSEAENVVSPAMLKSLGLTPEQQLDILDRPGTMLYLGDAADAEVTDAVTEADVLECQAKWANAIKTISATYLKKGDYIQAAADAAGELYGYGHSKVLFKPTKAAQYPFRPTGTE